MFERKPVIAILGGTGKEGPGLALRWATKDYKIIIGSRQQEKAERTAHELNKILGINTIEGYENGEFYFPIRDKTPMDLAACTVDSRTGMIRCASSGGLWDERGTVGFIDIIKTIKCIIEFS